MLHADEKITGWQHFEYEYTIPENRKGLRFEVNVIKPGSFRIDNFTIEPVNAG